MFGQLLGFQVVKEQRHLPLLAAVGLDLLAGLPRPVSLRSENAKDSGRSTLLIGIISQLERQQALDSTKART